MKRKRETFRASVVESTIVIGGYHLKFVYLPSVTKLHSGDLVRVTVEHIQPAKRGPR